MTSFVDATAFERSEYIQSLATYIKQGDLAAHRDLVKAEFEAIIRSNPPSLGTTRAALHTADESIIRALIESHGSAAFNVDAGEPGKSHLVYKLIRFEDQPDEDRMLIFRLVNEAFGPPDPKRITHYLAKAIENNLPDFADYLIEIASTVPGALDEVIGVHDVLERVNERTSPILTQHLAQMDPTSDTLLSLAKTSVKAERLRTIVALMIIGVDVRRFLPQPNKYSGQITNKLAAALASQHSAIGVYARFPPLDEVLAMEPGDLRRSLGILKASEAKQIARQKKRAEDEAMADIKRAERAAKRAAQNNS